VYLKTFERKLFKNTNVLRVEIQYLNKKNMVEKLEQYFDGMSIKVKNIEFLIEDEEEDSKFDTTMYTIIAPRHIKSSGIVQKLCTFEEIYKATIIE
jgi:putative Mg2+ transporter-C (MgtC) family protein